MRRAENSGRMSMRRLAVIVLAPLALATLGGCMGYGAGGPMASKDQFTYESSPTMPQSVSVVDTRTGETVWAMDIPVGQQLTLVFKNAGKKSNELGYDEMQWQLNVIGAPGRSLGNAMRVPPAYARRLDGTIREPEFGPVVATNAQPRPAAEAPSGMPWQAPPTIDLPENKPPTAD